MRYFADALEANKSVLDRNQLSVAIGLIEHLVTAILAHLDLRAITARDAYFCLDLSDIELNSPDLDLSHLLEYCYSFRDQSLSLCERLLRRLHLPSGVGKKQYALHNLLPSLEAVLSFVATEGRKLILDATANGAPRDFVVGGFHAIVTYGLATENIDRIPDDVIKRLNCGCTDCDEFVPQIFIGRGHCGFHIAQPKRVHLEKRLEGAGLRDYGISWETIKSGRPHMLSVCSFALFILIVKRC